MYLNKVYFSYLRLKYKTESSPMVHEVNIYSQQLNKVKYFKKLKN